MKEMTSQLYYLIIGTGSMDDLLQKEIDSVLDKNTYKWIKEIPNTEIHQFYVLSDFFVNFNKKEIFGMSILEAMYHGCTVIANHAPGPDMIIKTGETGYLTDDTVDMIKYLNKSDIIDRSTISEYVKKRFTWDKSASIIHKWFCQNNVVLEKEK